MITLAPYCKDSFAYHRRQSRVVHIGDVSLGGDYPIRIQSMTISDTMDTAATVAETIQLVEAGCELVRITAPSLNEAENLRHIKATLHKRGCACTADCRYSLHSRTLRSKRWNTSKRSGSIPAITPIRKNLRCGNIVTANIKPKPSALSNASNRSC